MANQCATSGSGEKGSNLGPISKEVSTIFACVLDVKCERKRGVKDNSKDLVVNNWKPPLAEMVNGGKRVHINGRKF